MRSSAEVPGRPAGAIAYAIAATGVGGLPLWMISAFAPQIQHDLGFSDLGLGIAIGAYFLSSTLTGLTAGRLVQRWGWRFGIAFSAVASGLCIIAMGALAYAWIALVITLALGAWSNNTSQPAANMVIAQNVPSRRQGMAFGLKQAAIPISTILVGLSVSVFDHGRLWREAFFCAAGVALLLGILVTASPLRDTIGARWGPGRDRRARQPRRTRAKPARFRAPRGLVLLSVGAGCGTAAVVSLGGFLVVFAVQQGLSVGDAGLLLALGSAVGVVGRILSGYLADRRGRRHLVAVAVMMIAGSLGFVVLAAVGHDPLGLIAGTVLTYGLGWSWNGVLHLSAVLYGEVPAPVATSIVQTAMSMGSTVGPVLFGVVSAWLFPAAWMMAALFLGAAATFTLLARRSLLRSGSTGPSD